MQPGRKTQSSREVGWTSLLFERWTQPATVEGFETVASPDQTIVLTASGTYDIEVLTRGCWRKARYTPGSGGATAPLHTSRIRWRSPKPLAVETLHLYVPPEYFSEAAEEYRRAGRRVKSSHVDALTFADPLVFSLALSLSVGIAREAPNLYADAAARMLATHLLLKSGTVQIQDLARGMGAELTDRRLARVIGFMQDHFAKELTLDKLAGEAGVSRFHFVRLFRKRLGVTPYQHLVRLRLEHAKFLLQTTDMDVSAVALACGYSHAGRFAAAFHAAFALQPSKSRREQR